MYFSYFARAQDHPDVMSGELSMVSIALYSPQWLPDIEKDPRLAPETGMFNEYRASILTTEEFIQQYIMKVSAHISAQRILEIYPNSVLCCYETINKFCHRQALRAWIENETGVLVHELSKTKKNHKQLDLFEGDDS